MMKAMDESVGRVVKALAEAKMLENSVIIFFSDNGAASSGDAPFANYGSNLPLRGVMNNFFSTL